MFSTSSSLLLLLATIPQCFAHAHDGNHHARNPSPTHHIPDLVARQNPYPTGPAYDVPPLISIVPTPVDYTSNTLPVATTYSAGTQPTYKNAPPLPPCESIPERLSISLLTNQRYYRALSMASPHRRTGHRLARSPRMAQGTRRQEYSRLYSQSHYRLW